MAPRWRRRYFESERNLSHSKTAKMAQPNLSPLEVSGDASPWKNMEVGSSKESRFTCSKQRLSKIAIAVALFLAVLYLLETSREEKDLVAPIYGDAYLTYDEFRDIRTARSQESVLVSRAAVYQCAYQSLSC